MRTRPIECTRAISDASQKRFPQRFCEASLIAIASLIALAPVAHAHDGGFGHSRRTLYVTVEDGALILEYRIQHNREDALVEMTLMDADGNGAISAEEKDTFLKARAKRLAENMIAKTAAGAALPLQFERARLDQALTQTFRYKIATAATEVLLEDHNFGHKPGLIQVRTADGLTVTLTKNIDLTHADRIGLRIRRTESGKK